ncbi:MAG TPA: alpha/beta hydrolase [Solirubrobacterales bacterium]|jgi:pimeloyl-ACP methyl ester carboxylesterase
MSARRSRLAVGPVDTRLVEAGPAAGAEALVFVHGNPGSADDWVRLAEAVGETGMRAVAFDLPDFGETEAAPGFEHSTPGYAGFVAEALAALGIERVHLLLHDFGGPIGLVWAASDPDAVASVTLIDTGILPGYKWHRLARIWRTPVLGEIFQATTTKRAFKMVVNRNEPRGLPPEFVDQMYDHADRRTKRAVLKLYRATDDPGAAGEEFARLMAPRDLPALVIWGEGDAYLPASYATRQREAFPSAEVHVLPASGHWPYADAPETVERLLVEFVSRLNPVGPASLPSG